MIRHKGPIEAECSECGKRWFTELFRDPYDKAERVLPCGCDGIQMAVTYRTDCHKRNGLSYKTPEGTCHRCGAVMPNKSLDKEHKP